MSKKLYDSGIRISKKTRDQVRIYCERNNLQQCSFADSTLLAAIGQGNGSKGKTKPASK